MGRNGVEADRIWRHLPVSHLCGNPLHRIDDLAPAAVVEGKDHVHGRVAPGQCLSVGNPVEQHRRNAGIFQVTHEADTHTEVVQFVATSLEEVDVEVHEERHLVLLPAPVLGRERVHRQPLDAHLEGAVHHVEQRWLSASVALRAVETTCVRPPTVSIHDDGNVARDRVVQVRVTRFSHPASPGSPAHVRGGIP